MIQRLRRPLLAFAIGVAAFVGVSHAAPYSNVVVFGDSLSDTGNVYSLTQAFGVTPFPDYPGAAGRFSNGPVWTDYLAAGLGAPAAAVPANLLYAGVPGVIPIGAPGGLNYAFGGARTGLGGAAGGTTGLIGQLINWNGDVFGAGLTRAADPNALYVVVAGANDLRDARNAFPDATPADDAGRTAAAAATAGAVVDVVALLAQAGARHFLMSNLPDLGLTPEAVELDVVAASSDVADKFNLALDAAVGSFEATFLGLTGVDLDIRMFDFAGVVDAVYADATSGGGAVYGITNVTSACIEPAAPDDYFFPGATDADGNCAVSGFSDLLHPSAALHRLIGQVALQTAVPEPATWLVVVVGLGAALRRRVR